MKKIICVCILICVSLFAFANDDYLYYDDYADVKDKYADYYDPYMHTVDQYSDYYDLYDELKNTTLENNISVESDSEPLTIENYDRKNEIIADITVLGSPNNNECLDLLKELQKSKEINVTPRGIEGEVKAEVPTAKENRQHSFYAEGTFGPTIRFLRGTNFALGGHIAVNFFAVHEFSFGPYIHGEYFIAPLGSTSGLLAGLEMELEAGLNLTFPIFRSPHFTIKIGSDVGYYMQWLQYNSDISSDAHLTYNGLLLRPTVTFDFAKLWGMPIGISFFYQVTVMMPYQDYNGFGIMLNL